MNETCNCLRGFRGHRCEIGIRVIMPVEIYNMCENGGTMYVQSGQEGCVCPCGFIGERCELEYNFLTTTPEPVTERVFPFCENGGKVKTTLGHRTCECPCFFFGQHCQFSNLEYRTDYADNCPFVHCYNGGTCYRYTGMCTPKCRCANGYSGPLCETKNRRRIFQLTTPYRNYNYSSPTKPFKITYVIIPIVVIVGIIVTLFCCQCCNSERDGKCLPKRTRFINSTSQSIRQPQHALIDRQIPPNRRNETLQQSTRPPPYVQRPTTVPDVRVPPQLDVHNPLIHDNPPSYEETCDAPLPTYNEAIGHI